MTDLISRSDRGTRSGGGLGPLLRAHPELGLLPLRLFLGVTFAFAGLQKLADPSFLDAHNPRSLQGQLALVRHTSPLPLLGVVADHAVFFGVVIALVELAVGVATLLGLWTRLAALVGALLSLSFFLTISWSTTPYYYGSDIGFVFAWTPFILLGAPVLSLDAWRVGRPQLVAPAAAGAVAGGAAARAGGARPAPGRSGARAGGRPVPARADVVDPDRRGVLATGAVGAAVLAVAGLDAGIGRAVRGSGSGTPAATGPTAAPTHAHPKHTPSGHPSSHHATHPPAVAGTPIGSTSDLPVGSALRFTDPASGQQAYAVQPTAGDYRAFSAVCTHAGCTVFFAKDSQQFQCPCHGGLYDGKTGQVLAGPPPAPLQPIQVKASGGKLVVPEGA